MTQWSQRLLLSCAVSALMVGAAQAGSVLPTGGVFAAGSGSIGAATASGLTVTQLSSKAIINWQSFSIGQGLTVQITTTAAAPRSTGWSATTSRRSRARSNPRAPCTL